MTQRPPGSAGAPVYRLRTAIVSGAAVGTALVALVLLGWSALIPVAVIGGVLVLALQERSGLASGRGPGQCHTGLPLPLGAAHVGPAAPCSGRLRRRWHWWATAAATTTFVVGVPYVAVLWTLFGNHDGGVRSCDGGFRVQDWTSERTATGRAIAKCDWLDGWSTRRVRHVLGPPSAGREVGYLVWDVGPSKSGIGPTSWFLILRERGGRIVLSTAERRPV